MVTETIEYRSADKTDWQRGPWDEEPDKVQWQDAATGLPCLIVRNRIGALCGYVGVGPTHPWHGKSYNDVDVEVHGGLTFSDSCHEATREVWEKWRVNMEARKPEAAKYPRGDSARAWKERGHLMNDYDGWAKHMEGASICHKGGDFEPAWWFGFDCAHGGDIMPAMRSEFRGQFEYESYKDIAYVQREVAMLARQIASAEPK